MGQMLTVNVMKLCMFTLGCGPLQGSRLIAAFGYASWNMRMRREMQCKNAQKS